MKALRRISKFKFSKTMYQILEISETASVTEIKKAYLKKAKIMHPDRLEVKSDEANKAFQELVDSYQTLKNSEMRKMYDINLRQGINKRPEKTHDFGSSKRGKEFYQNRWYDYKPPADDIRFTDESFHYYQNYTSGASQHIWWKKYISVSTYHKLTSLRSKFIYLLVALGLFEFWYSKVQKKENRRLNLLHEMEEKNEDNVSLKQYIQQRSSEKDLFT